MPDLQMASTARRMVIALQTAWQAHREGLAIFAIMYVIFLALTLAILTFVSHWTIASVNDFLVVAGIVFILVFIAARSVLNDEKMAKERRQELQDVAVGMHATYLGSEPFSQYPQLQMISILDKEGSLTNLITGEEDGFVWRFFDFEYDIGSDDGGANFKTHSVLSLESKSQTFPAFCMKPAGVVHELAAKVGLVGPKDFKVDGWQAFNERFVLQSGRRSKLLPVFDRNIGWFFEEHPDLHVEAASHVLLLYRKHVECTPAYVRTFLDMALTLAKLLLRENRG